MHRGAVPPEKRKHRTGRAITGKAAYGKEQRRRRARLRTDQALEDGNGTLALRYGVGELK